MNQEPGATGAGGGEEVAPGVWVRGEAVRVHFVRSSGPGGQNVNKVNTKADLRVAIEDLAGLPGYARAKLLEIGGQKVTLAGEVHITAESERTQEGNRAAAMAALRELLVRAMHRDKPRRKTKPSRASQRRRVEQKKRRGAVKRLRREGE